MYTHQTPYRFHLGRSGERSWDSLFCKGTSTQVHVRGGPELLSVKGPLQPRQSLDSYRAPERTSTFPIQRHTPVLVVGTFMVEAFIVGLHVAQTGIVIGINKGQMNLKAEETWA